ncbi:MAG: tetratricopeptide repeat protein [Spirochaetaceae bacterium]|jgi:Flp pilus assembly protein TadD|nr:tetratricopeptide repeat protein [Spirochaetaceae bacterium]
MNNNTLGAKFILLVIAFTALASLSAGAQTHNKDYYYERARWKLATGDNAGALEDLNLIVSLTPDDPQAYNSRGIIYEKCGDYTAARADYEHALWLNPDSAEARHNISNLNEKLGVLNLADTGTVSPAYAQSYPVQQQSNTPARPAQQGYAAVPVQQQSYTPARSAQQGYAAAQPVQQAAYGSVRAATYTGNLNTSAANYYRAGMVGMFRQTGVAAASGYGHVLQPAAFQAGAGVYGQPVYGAPLRKTLIDGSAENRNNYGVTLNSSGRFDEAILKFTEAIDIYPEYAIAYNNRGVAYAAIGDFVRAAEDFTKALRINPYYYDAQVNYLRINGTTRVAAITR